MTFAPKTESFEAVKEWLERELRPLLSTDVLLRENIAIFEELFIRICDFASDGTEVTAEVRSGMTGVRVILSFPGERFVVDYENGDPLDPGLLILDEFSNKLSFSYKRRINTVEISSKLRYNRTMYLSLAAIPAAVIAGFIISFISSRAVYSGIERVISVLLSYFFDGIMMIAAPVTFFSLIINVSDCVVQFDRTVSMKRMFIQMLVTSVGAVAVSYLLYLASENVLRDIGMVAYETGGAVHLTENFYESLLSIVPTDIFSAFTVTSPFPLIVLAVLFIVALCSMNNKFDAVRSTVNTLNEIVCKILAYLMALQPAVTFLAVLDLVISEGFRGLMNALTVFVLIIIGAAVVFLALLIDLWVKGINPVRFMRRTAYIFAETLKINSCIDAVPYISRQLSRGFGIERRLTRGRLNILAQLNLDGNCLVLSLIALMEILDSGSVISPLEMAFMAVLIIALSFGAPNQPGSVVIGMSIVNSFLGISGYVDYIILFELVTGPLLLIMNTAPDLMIVFKEVRRQGKLKKL